MPTQADIADYQAQTVDLSTLAIANLVEFWLANSAADPLNWVGDWRDLIVSLTDEYANAVADVALDFYQASRPDGLPAFAPTPTVRPDLVSTNSLNWINQPLFTEETGAALDRAAARIQTWTAQAGHETLGNATVEDPAEARYARWPRNAKPCAFCVLRASRGAIFWSEDSAESGDHDHCGCAVAVVWAGDPLPYQRKPYIAQYQAGAAETDGTGFKALLAGMRRANGTR